MRAASPWIVLLACLVVVQSVLAPLMEIRWVKPDFFLISVLLVAMKKGGGAALGWGVLAGLFQDALSGGIAGFNLLTKPAVGFTVGFLRPKLDFENPNTQSVVTLAAAAAEGLLLALLLEAFQPEKAALWTLGSIVVPSAVYSAIVLPLLPAAGRLVAHEARRMPRRAEQAE